MGNLCGRMTREQYEKDSEELRAKTCEFAETLRQIDEMTRYKQHIEREVAAMREAQTRQMQLLRCLEMLQAISTVKDVKQHHSVGVMTNA